MLPELPLLQLFYYIPPPHRYNLVLYEDNTLVVEVLLEAKGSKTWPVRLHSEKNLLNYNWHFKIVQYLYPTVPTCILSGWSRRWDILYTTQPFYHCWVCCSWYKKVYRNTSYGRWRSDHLGSHIPTDTKSQYCDHEVSDCAVHIAKRWPQSRHCLGKVSKYTIPPSSCWYQSNGPRPYILHIQGE